jgi:hypothetical protein
MVVRKLKKPTTLEEWGNLLFVPALVAFGLGLCALALIAGLRH